MIAEDISKKYILRFNINAFRNGYHLTDLAKMNLIYYGVLVGKMPLNKLSIDKEFDYMKKTEVSAEMVLGEDTSDEYQEYKTVTDATIIEINRGFENRIVGQNNVKRKLLKALLPLTLKERKKPVVLLLYGSSGIGKTETKEIYLREKKLVLENSVITGLKKYVVQCNNVREIQHLVNDTFALAFIGKLTSCD